jgi:hypothetical protein
MLHLYKRTKYNNRLFHIFAKFGVFPYAVFKMVRKKISEYMKEEVSRMEWNAVFWDATPCGSCNNLRFGGT